MDSFGDDASTFVSVDFEGTHRQRAIDGWCWAGFCAYKLTRDGVQVLETGQFARPVFEWDAACRNWFETSAPEALAALEKAVPATPDGYTLGAHREKEAEFGRLFDGFVAKFENPRVVVDFSDYDGVILHSAVEAARCQSLRYDRHGEWVGRILDTGYMGRILDYADVVYPRVDSKRRDHTPVNDAIGIAEEHWALRAAARGAKKMVAE